ncbi:LysR family transcriptional regulator [Tengunoibacter tsumagoiensis]|uniref:LysR family transcriptional regulator n=1 Tax=Tengunoibacter tsumagoiensis TaxID=2014871 RepID=A0A402A8E6_9CHLR|nr:LysR family transcriptional regulator [Tengunoibacter tsumagoiensis]GCE15275.1 LysR family transcriptional regulator [Tengunoibacter tsumagoiensis]
MDFIYLQTLCEVAKWENFTRAADVLGYAQSSVTTQIQKLEAQYGVVLFERHGPKMQPTQAGDVLIAYARQILALHEEVKAQLISQQTGSLTIGTIETLAACYLPSLLQTFHKEHPNMTLALQLGNEDSIIQSIQQGTCDLGLILDTATQDPDLISISVRQEALVIVTCPDSSYRMYKEITPQDLVNASFILTEQGCTYRAFLLQELKKAGIAYHMLSAFESLEAIKQCVMRGLGIAFLPSFAVQEEVAQGKLLAIPFAPQAHFSTQVIFLKRKWRSHAFQSLLDLLSSVPSVII